MSHPFDAALQAAQDKTQPQETPAVVSPTIEAVAPILDKNQPEVAPEPAPEVIPAEVPATDPAETDPQAPETVEATDDSFFTNPLKNKGKEPDPQVELNADAEEYRALKNDTEFQIFQKYKKAGKSLSDLAKDYEYVDYKKMDPDALTQQYGKLKGLTEDQIEEAISEINGLGPLSKARELEAMQNELQNEQNTKLQNLGGTAEAQVAFHNKIRSQYTSEVDQIRNDMVGKDYYGVKFDQETAQKWHDFASNFSLQREDGTLATERVFKWFLSEIIPQVQSTAAKKSHHQGREEILKEMTRPVKEAPNGKLPIAAKTGAKHDPIGLTQSMTRPPSER